MNKADECLGFAEDERRIASYFDERARRFGDDPRALDWSSRTAQQARFRVLSEIGIETGHSVLDVGCGQGDFCLWLQENGIRVDYVGLDLSEQMLTVARAKVPHARLFKGSVCDLEAELGRFDWVVASGIFYLRQCEPYESMRSTVSSMFALADRGVAFNTLADWGGGTTENAEFRAIPAKVLELCRSSTPYVLMRADYHVADITLYLFKECR